MKKKYKISAWDLLWGMIIISAVFIGIFFFTLANIPTEDIQSDIESNEDRIIIETPKSTDRTNFQQTVVEKEEPVEDYEIGKFTRDYQWYYDGYTYGITLILYPKVYENFRERERTRDYDLFASDYYSKEFIKSITDILSDYGKDNGLQDAEIPYFIISFVQGLEYTSDDVTTGFDEYPRFPYETIYDNGGDCEDTSILAAAMIHELGYGVALLQFPKHLAVGVKCTPSPGQSYYTHYGIDYCFLETTGNWDVGEVPPNLKGESAIVQPIFERPSLEVDFTSKYEYNWRDVYVDVDVNVRNLGSETAENTIIYVALQAEEEGMVWDQIESDELTIEPEAGYEYTVSNLHVPTGENFRIYVFAYGDNVVSDEAYSNWIYWE